MRLYCQVFGDQGSFLIQIGEQASVCELQEAIQEKLPNHFRGLYPHELNLWKWNKPDTVKNSDLHDRSILDGFKILDMVFQDGTEYQCLHIVIKASRK